MQRPLRGACVCAFLVMLLSSSARGQSPSPALTAWNNNAGFSIVFELPEAATLRWKPYPGRSTDQLILQANVTEKAYEYFGLPYNGDDDWVQLLDAHGHPVVLPATATAYHATNLCLGGWYDPDTGYYYPDTPCEVLRLCVQPCIAVPCEPDPCGGPPHCQPPVCDAIACHVHPVVGTQFAQP